MQAAELVREYISAWNRRDPMGIVGLLTNNGFYFDVPTNEKHSGQALVRYLDNDFSQRNFHYDLVGEILIGESTAAFQYRTHNVDDPADSTARLHGAEFLTVRGDKVTSIEDYYKFPAEPDVENVVTGTDGAISASKYRKSGMRPDQEEAYKHQLLTLMRAERLYLNPDLTLPELARSMNCSVNHLSQVINGGLQMRFYDFLNQYRVEAAKRLLITPPSCRYPVGRVAELAGFASTSAFYVAFRRAARRTPSEYRKLHRKD